MDGNNSAKCLLSAGKSDDREFTSDYFLSREEVDVFKDEVVTGKKSGDADEEEEDDSADTDAPWILDDLDDNGRPVPCADNWKASVAEHMKRSKAIYDATGIFPAACRHGLILNICEMIQSGEL